MSTANGQEAVSGLRQRGKQGDAMIRNAPESAASAPQSDTQKDATSAAEVKEQPNVIGRTPDGTVFRVPNTPDMLSSIFDPRQPKTPLDIVTVVSLVFQIVCYFVLSRRASQIFFFVYFAFWRGSYNLGLGWILKRQSEKGWIIRQVKLHGWMDAKRKPRVHQWVKQQLITKMEQDYDFEATPMDYNVWLMFRSMVDLILLNDFVAYSLFAFACTRLPEGHSVAMHVLRWIAGWTLIFFNLWVKMDAHRVVKDYAWYWGDCFFLCLQSLVFDGVYEIAPDPMYSIGYAGYYGLSLVSGSYAVLFVSLAAHFSQFLFMTFFEGPHIERTYGEKKPLAARVPLRQAPFNAASRNAVHDDRQDATADKAEADVDGPTPSQTEGSTAMSTDESSGDEDATVHKHIRQSTLRTASSSNDAIQTRLSDLSRDQRKVTTLHDLHHRIFRKDTVIFRNLDLMRANDFLLVIASAYAVFPLVLPAMGPKTRLGMLFLNALVWRMIHSVGLGIALSRQSESKWIVRHYLKTYHYTKAQDAVFEAFANWKIIYNTSLVMTYLSFSALAWNCYSFIGRSDWTVGPDLLRHTLGFLLVALHVWTANSSYNVLGPFGWLYGDFFVDEYPHQLYYTGIYRFLNNPERSMGGAAFFGMALISGSKVTLTMAIFSYMAHWGFLSFVEGPHMRKLYGNAALRKHSGVSKQLRSQWVAARHSDLFKAAQEHPTIKNVQGTLEKVQRDATEAFEEFFKQSKPRIEGMLEDTKILLQQSRDRLLIVRVEDDEKLRSHGVDKTKYSLRVASASADTDAESMPRFHLGEPIHVHWTVASTHSRGDWIGLYLLSRFGGKEGADQSSFVTKISSQGKWLGVAQDEWVGDEYVGSRSDGIKKADDKSEADALVSGTSIFRDDKLPWIPGMYELRYHHDAKHNVLARSEPIEIYVPTPSMERGDDADQFKEICSVLRKIVHFSKPTTRPHRLSISSAMALDPAAAPRPLVVDSQTDPDDFTIWDTKQAKKISLGIRYALDTELSPDVIIAEANIVRLATDVIQGRKVLQPLRT